MAIITRNKYQDEFWGAKFYREEVDVELEEGDIEDIKEEIKEALLYGFAIPTEWEVEDIIIDIWEYLDIDTLDEIMEEILPELEKEEEFDLIEEIREKIEKFKKENK